MYNRLHAWVTKLFRLRGNLDDIETGGPPPNDTIFRMIFNSKTILFSFIGFVIVATYALLTVNLDAVFFGFRQPHVKDIPNPLDPRENMTISIDIHSPTFAVGSRAIFFVGLYPNETNARPETDKYFIELDGTYCEGRKYVDNFAPIPNCSFVLSWDESKGRYYGYDNVRLARVGNFDVSLYTNQTDKSNATHVSEKFIPISNAEATINLRIFKLTVGLGALGIIFGAIGVYYQYHLRKQKQ